MICLWFRDDLITEIGLPLVKKGIKSLTGIDIESKELTPEDKQKLLESQVEIMKIDFEKLKEENRAKEFVVVEANKNTDSARNMNSEIQTSENASELAKNTAYYLDIILVLSTIVLAFTLFVLELPLENKELAYMMFGSLLTLTGTVVNFHRGSSQSSTNNQDELNKLKRL